MSVSSKLSVNSPLVFIAYLSISSPEPKPHNVAYRMGLEPASVRLLTLSHIEISKTSRPIAIIIYMKPSIIGVRERLH